MLSIIVPTLNEERAIEGTLRGIRQLNGLPYEVIVSDSGSTDDTALIARRYADKVVGYSDRPSFARGRNFGASFATGDILVFLDADVTICNIRTFFLKARQRFADDPQLVAIVPQVKVAREVRTRADGYSYKIVNAYFYFVNNILGGGVGPGDCLIVRASTFSRVCGYDERLPLYEDVDICERLAKVGKVRMDWSMLVVHPCRRPHTIGWAKLWWQCVTNLVSMKLLGRPWDSEWIPIR